MDINNGPYTKAINQKINSLIGMISSTEWSQCLQSNTTYLDCPIALNGEEKPISVAIQNPSTVENSNIKIAVPHGHYKVKTFNYKT
jgi:hypothetical protein